MMGSKLDKEVIKAAIRKAIAGRNLIYRSIDREPLVDVALYPDGTVEGFFSYGRDDTPLPDAVATATVRVGIDAGNVHYAEEVSAMLECSTEEAKSVIEEGEERFLSLDREIASYWSESGASDDGCLTAFADEAYDKLKCRLADIDG
ncbi:MAG: hypothetical protein HQL42_10860 [Alphaproteobacteria bacterium]|nr:hypothetical protein [Alphaproteobacteria bacterium]